NGSKGCTESQEHRSENWRFYTPVFVHAKNEGCMMKIRGYSEPNVCQYIP
ncbi:hypothetical protein WG66_014717, partial [Moniliophthora roreri]